MAVTNEELFNIFLENPNMSDAEIVSLMETQGISPEQVSSTFGIPVGEVISRAAETVPEGTSVTLGDTRIAPQYEVRGSGEDRQVVGIENIYVEKTTGDVNYKSPVGSDVQVLSPTGELVNTIKTKEDQSFFGGLADAFNDPVVQAAFLGLGGGGALGNALGLTGSTAQAVGTGLFKGGAAAAGGASLEDALKTGLLSGGLVYGGNELSNAIKYQDVPVDFTNMTQDQINDALDINFRNDLARAGMSDAQIKSFLANPASVYDTAQTVTTPTAVSTPVADSGTVSVTAPTTPSLSNTLNTIASTTPTLTVSAPKATQMSTQEAVDLVNSQIAANVKTPANLANLEVTGNRPATVQEVINAITATLPTVTPTQAATIAEQVVTSNRPVTTQEVINAITASLPSVTATTTPTKTDTTTTKTKETDPIKVAQLALSAAGLLGAGAALSNTGTPTGFDVVPVPTDWKTPPKTGVAPFTPLTPINFGDRNLLIGTQWEKFLDPNYGKVPEPVQYSQPSNLSYNDLMGILGSKQGMPPASSLSINDIISGIQNQYGQANRSAMGQKPA